MNIERSPWEFPPVSTRIPFRIIVPGILALIAVWTTYYTIPAESEGVVLRFGKYIAKVLSGVTTIEEVRAIANA